MIREPGAQAAWNGQTGDRQPKSPLPGGATFGIICLLLLLFRPAPSLAQALEMQAAQGGPTGTGPSVAPQVVTLRMNTNNPTGNTFAVRTPPLTVTYSLSNQQYTGLTPAQGFPAGTGGNGVFFGGETNAFTPTAVPSNLYDAMDAVGIPASTMYTSSGNSTPGTGISVGVNGAVQLFISSRALLLQPLPPATNARVQMADLTLTFSQPVSNPVVHIVGAGGFNTVFGRLGFSAEYDLLTSTLGLTRLSGNPAFTVTGSSVRNAAITPSTSCASSDEAACGSVRIDGSGISSVTLRIFLRGDGQGPAWNNSAQHGGDMTLVGVSLNPISDLVITKTNTPAAGPSDQPSDAVVRGTTTTYTLRVTNNGGDPVTGAVVKDTPVAGITCPPGGPVTITGAGVPSGSYTIANLTAGIALGVLNSGQSTVLTFSCSVN